MKFNQGEVINSLRNELVSADSTERMRLRLLNYDPTYRSRLFRNHILEEDHETSGSYSLNECTVYTFLIRSLDLQLLNDLLVAAAHLISDCLSLFCVSMSQYSHILAILSTVS